MRLTKRGEKGINYLQSTIRVNRCYDLTRVKCAEVFISGGARTVPARLSLTHRASSEQIKTEHIIDVYLDNAAEPRVLDASFWHTPLGTAGSRPTHGLWGIGAFGYYARICDPNLD